MSTLNVRGINWEISRENGKPVYTHQNIKISWEPKSGTWQAKDHDGGMIIARELPSVCIKDMTIHILDTYASRIVPSWEVDNEEEIPCTFEEAEEEAQEEGRRDTVPDAIYQPYTG